MAQDREQSHDPFGRAPSLHASRARVATLRNLADCAGSAFGWDEDTQSRLGRDERLHAARRALGWTLACIVLVALFHVTLGQMAT